jgi:signal transduction histidine kinase
MLVMFLYNLALLLITRDKTYAYYISFLITLLLAQVALFGYTDRYLMPGWPALNQKYTVLSGAVVGLFTALFMINFLQLRQRAPLFAKLIVLLAVMDIFGILLLAMDRDVLAFHLVNFASTYGSVVGIIAAIKLARAGFKPAKFFLIAWSILVVSVIIFALNNLGIIPYKPYFQGAMLFGSSIEVVLLSIALADRINVLKKEKEDSQKEALVMAKENERIIREQNTLLEQKVQMRTKELQGANEELKVTLENLKTAQMQLVQSEKMASLGVLTAGVAHELNNPLNYIHGGYTAINDELENEHSDLNKEELKQYLQWIQSGSEKAIRIVKSLNIYSRTSEDYTEDCNLNAIIEDCLSILQHRIKDQIEVKRALSDNMGTVKGNSGKLHQAVLNLLDNATDAIEQNGVITISTSTTDHHATLTIEDNGSGISKEHLNKVLDPFFTTKPPGKGTGLGLSIVHSIIQEHGGRIHFDSEPGQGTTVTISLPKLSTP